MVNKMWLKRALDTSNAFGTWDTEAQAVNPDEYDFQLREYVGANTVIAALGEQYDFTKPGSTNTVTVDEAPTAAAALTETIATTISSISNRQVTFTPTEYGKAFQTTKKELARGFFDIMSNMTRKLGYSLALIRDTTAYSTCVSGAGNSVMVNGKSATTDLASTDTINYASIINARKEIRKDYYRVDRGAALVISPTQEGDLLALGTVHKVNEYGSNEALKNAYIGKLFGFDIFVSDSITPTANVEVALALGTHPTGEKAFGFAMKRFAEMGTEFHLLGRYYDIAADEDWDVQVLHPNAVCKVYTYSA